MKALNRGADCGTPSVTTPILRIALDVVWARAMGGAVTAHAKPEREAEADEKHVRSLPRKRCESRVDLAAVDCVENLDSQPHCASGYCHLSQRCLGWGDSRVDEHGQIFGSRHQLKQ